MKLGGADFFTRHPVRGAASLRCAADTGSLTGPGVRQDPGSAPHHEGRCVASGMTGGRVMAAPQKLIGISLEGRVG